MASKHGLGRGLGALIPEGMASDARIPQTDVPIDRVVPNPWQPRSFMNEEKLAELAESIRAHGIIQPLLVTEERDAQGERYYQLIAGERRLRAAKAAGLERVPVTIRQSTPQELLELAIIENVQRADLSPLEEAASYQRLIDEFHLTQQDVATRVGKSRVAVTNTIRILALAPEIQQSIANGEISEGHARALLGIADETLRLSVWEQVVARSLSVRQTERLAREATRPSDEPTEVAPEPEAVQHERAALEQAVQRVLGTKVSLRRSPKGAGALTIHFYSDEELEGVLDRLGVGEM
ncbi:MAG: ParB/RepB/Spo0J family partition protein [Dehalococcoidia bacterium]